MGVVGLPVRIRENCPYLLDGNVFPRASPEPRAHFGRVSLTAVCRRSYSLDCGGPIAPAEEDVALMPSGIAGYGSSYKLAVCPRQNTPAGTWARVCAA